MKRIISLIVLKIFAVIMFFNEPLIAAGESDYPANYYDKVALFLILVVIFGFLSLIYFESKVRIVKEKQPSVFWQKFKYILTKSHPLEREHELVLVDHNYDGIKELDSRIPPWFLWLFYGTIIFSVIYMLHYHVLGTGPLMEEEYAQEVKQAEIKRAELIRTGAFINEETVTLLTEPVALESGKQIFNTNCAACHAADGGGLVGPNLTDDYWIHGGGIKNVFKVVKYGVVNKGMIAWQNMLNPKQIQEVSSYVLSLKGTTPAKPKAPEGEIWKEQQ
jgi:cytochrome c oxidase cbb3-type subunit 3